MTHLQKQTYCDVLTPQDYVTKTGIATFFLSVPHTMTKIPPFKSIKMTGSLIATPVVDGIISPKRFQNYVQILKQREALMSAKVPTENRELL